MNLTKLAPVALVAILFAGAVVSFWIVQMMNNSWHSDGTVFSQYAAKYPPAAKVVSTEAASWCDPAYNTKWAGCNMK